MADTKLTGLTELTAVDPADLLYIVDDPGGTPTGKKATVENVQADWHVGAKVYNDASISIGDSTGTSLTLNTEVYDTDTIHDTGSNTDRLTCKTAGIYLVRGSVRWDVNATGVRQSSIKLNGTTSLVILRDNGPSASESSYHSPSVIYELSVNDYLTLVVYQTSGGSLNVVYGAEYSPYFEMQRIG